MLDSTYLIIRKKETLNLEIYFGLSMKKIISFYLFLIISLVACATKYSPVKSYAKTNPMLIGGKSNVMKFSIFNNSSTINIKNPRIKSITRVAEQSSTATIVILFPPHSLKIAEQYYDLFNKNRYKVMRPIQAAIVDENKVTDFKNIYVYVTFTPILVANKLNEESNETIN